MELKDYLRILRRRWITILAVAVVVFAGLFVYTKKLPPSYEAVISVLLRDKTVLMKDSQYQMEFPGATSQDALIFYEYVPFTSRLQLMKSDTVLERTVLALAPLGVHLAESELSGMISTTQAGPSEPTQIRVSHASRQAALDIVNTLIHEFIEEESEIIVQGARREREILETAIAQQLVQLKAEEAQLQEEIQKSLQERGIYDLDLEAQVKSQLLVGLETDRQRSLQQIHRMEYQLRKMAPPPVKEKEGTAAPEDPLLDEAPSQPTAAQRLTELLRTLRASTRKYTDMHPSIVALRAEIATLREEALREFEQAAVRKREELVAELIYLKESVDLTEDIARDEYRAITLLGMRRDMISDLREKFRAHQARLLQNEDRLERIDRALKIKREERQASMIVIKKPRVIMSTSLAPPWPMVVLISLLLGLASSYLHDMFDSSFLDTASVKRYLNLSVIASIPAATRGPASLLESAPRTPLWEVFHYLGTVLQKLRPGSEDKVFVIASSEARVGKTLISSNLGIAMAGESRRVLIIDGDMRNPRQHEVFGLSNSLGLSAYLSGRLRATSELDKIQQMASLEPAEPELPLPPPGPMEASTDLSVGDLRALEDLSRQEPPPTPLPPTRETPKTPKTPMSEFDMNWLTQGIEQCIQPTSVTNLFVMTAGLCPSNPAALLDSPETAALIRYARSKYDMVIIDTPPVLYAADALILAGYGDLTAFTLVQRRTTREGAQAAKQMLEKTNATFAGALMNFATQTPNEYYYYYYHGSKYVRSSP